MFIPFLFELRVLLDWLCVPTSLDDSWLQMGHNWRTLPPQMPACFRPGVHLRILLLSVVHFLSLTSMGKYSNLNVHCIGANRKSGSKVARSRVAYIDGSRASCSPAWSYSPSCRCSFIRTFASNCSLLCFRHQFLLLCSAYYCSRSVGSQTFTPSPPVELSLRIQLGGYQVILYFYKASVICSSLIRVQV